MKNAEKIKIFIVDDDPLYLKSLELDFTEHPDFTIETYPTGELCLENLSREPSIIVLDYFLDGVDKTAMNGIETLDKIKAKNSGIPVVMLSSQDKIDVAVKCMHHGAFDYVVKSETSFLRLQKIFAIILDFNKMEKELSWYMDRM